MSYRSSPLGSVVVQVESADVGKPKIVVDNDDWETAALSSTEATAATSTGASIEARGTEVFSPTKKNRKLSPEGVQPTLSTASVEVVAAAAAAATKEDKVASLSIDDEMNLTDKGKKEFASGEIQPTFFTASILHRDNDDGFSTVDFHGSHDNHSCNENSSISSPLGNDDNAVVHLDKSDIGTEKISSAADIYDCATVIGTAKSLEESSDEEVFTPCNKEKRKLLLYEEIQPTFLMALDPNASSHHDDGSFTLVDFHGSQDNRSFAEDASMSSQSSNVVVHMETADDVAQKIPFAVDDNDGATEAAAMMEARGKEVLLPSKGKRKLSEIQTTTSEVVVVVAAAKEEETASSSSMDMKGVTSSYFTDRAKRKLFQEEEQLSPTAKG
eukprot:scaffold36668_cov161-Skeletonema_dohrnii-CCMP3373.AAC.1